MSDPADDPEGEAAADEDSEWEYSLEDIDEREAEAEAAAEAERKRREPLAAGSPSVENALFVVLGVLFTLFIISRPFVA